MNHKDDLPPRPSSPSGDNAPPVDQLVDRFVAAINTRHREPVNVELDETPPSVLVGDPDEDGWCDWAIKPYAAIDWIEPVQQRLGHSFPAVFRSLVTRYIFPGFEAGEVFFFANTPEGPESRELRKRAFSEDLFRALQRSGYLQIGQPAGGGYDPLCFALHRGDDDDCPIVQIDHEGILCDGAVNVIHEIAPSLRHLMSAVVGGAG